LQTLEAKLLPPFRKTKKHPHITVQTASSEVESELQISRCTSGEQKEIKTTNDRDTELYKPVNFKMTTPQVKFQQDMANNVKADPHFRTRIA
jgi:hypothetical protein